MSAVVWIIVSLLALGGDVNPTGGQAPAGQAPAADAPAPAVPAPDAPAPEAPDVPAPDPAQPHAAGAPKKPAPPPPPKASATYTQHNCSERLVLCIEPQGTLFDLDRKETLRVGERLHVIVLGERIGNMTTSIEVSSARSGNTLFDRRVGVRKAATPEKLADRVIEVPDADTLTIYVVQKKDDHNTTGSLTLEIQDTLYFARAGLAFTWVDRGSRTITPEHAIIDKTEFFPGVALTIWPWGHRSKTLSAFDKLNRRTFGDLLAFQIGTDFDFSSPFDRTFFGVTIEPISGIGISGGVAVLTGQFFSGAPAGSDMAVSDKYMWRPYVSLSLTSEILDTLRKIAGKEKEAREQ